MVFCLQRERRLDFTAEHNVVWLSFLSGTELCSAVLSWVFDRCCGENQTDVHCLSLRLDWKHVSIFCQPLVLPFHAAWLIGHWFGCHDTVLWSLVTTERSVHRRIEAFSFVSELQQCVSQTQEEIVMQRKATPAKRHSKATFVPCPFFPKPQ